MVKTSTPRPRRKSEKIFVWSNFSKDDEKAAFSLASVVLSHCYELQKKNKDKSVQTLDFLPEAMKALTAKGGRVDWGSLGKLWDKKDEEVNRRIRQMIIVATKQLYKDGPRYTDEEYGILQQLRDEDEKKKRKGMYEAGFKGEAVERADDERPTFPPR